jgi:hypothetical protein
VTAVSIPSRNYPEPLKRLFSAGRRANTRVKIVFVQVLGLVVRDVPNNRSPLTPSLRKKQFVEHRGDIPTGYTLFGELVVQ